MNCTNEKQNSLQNQFLDYAIAFCVESLQCEETNRLPKITCYVVTEHNFLNQLRKFLDFFLTALFFCNRSLPVPHCVVDCFSAMSPRAGKILKILSFTQHPLNVCKMFGRCTLKWLRHSLGCNMLQRNITAVILHSCTVHQ
jgi:hypothetical protein